MVFELIGEIKNVEPLASGRGVRVRKRLKKKYGGNRWRKLRGFGLVRLEDGSVRWAEIHWYEAHGVGRRELKVKLPFLDDEKTH